ncbi:MAG: hypothetical protein KDA84_24905 [Planctomycetaceae bacterium]|nr:hypothetical protein [Planctomycetaceae bacterium]
MNRFLFVTILGGMCSTGLAQDSPFVSGRVEGEPKVLVSPGLLPVGGITTHKVQSPYQSGETEIRVLLPDSLKAGKKYPVIYVLPVEGGRGNRYGDGLLEVKKHDLHNKHQTIFVAPTFSELPWYADHPTKPKVRQESYLINVVVPLVEKLHPVSPKPEDRLLLGFSKSGWGAWTLLLRNPDTFGRAAAWDAPLMMQKVGKYGNGPIFATQENFEAYRPDHLLRKNAKRLQNKTRLILTGIGNFQSHHEQTHQLLGELKIPHEYRDAPQRKHDWHSGWVPEAVELLLQAEFEVQ